MEDEFLGQQKKPKMYKGDWDDKIKSKFAECGENTFVGHNCVIPRPEKVFLADNVRIDPFCLITAEVHIGPYSQIMSHSVLGGGVQQKIILHGGNFVGYGSKLFTASEDYSGKYGMIGDQWFDNKIHRANIEFLFYSGVASDVIVMPGVKLPIGCTIGAKSFVYSHEWLKEWAIFYGNPLRFRKDRVQLQGEPTLRR